MSQPYDSAPIRMEHYEVVMLKRTASEATCTPEDFVRVPVQAESTDQARYTKEVEAKGKDYYTMFVVPPGIETQPESQARQRALEGAAVCRMCFGHGCVHCKK